MRFKANIFFLFFTLSAISTIAQNNKYTLSGFLKDIKNGEVLIGENVFVQGNNELGGRTNI